MYEEWPLLEFPDLGKSILDLFSRPTSEAVASALVLELSKVDSGDDLAIRLQTEDQLRWTMQVLNHALTFTFSTDKEYESLKLSVRIYLHWLRALTDIPDGLIPAPLLDTPEKYFKIMIDSLRAVFCLRLEDSSDEIPKGLAIERQASEIENILDTVRFLTQSASRKYQNEVWARSLSFLLNSSDLLLSDPSAAEVGIRVGCRVVDTLFELWFKAVLHEEIPSPTYWRTLSVLCKRWRHHVTVIESWARKLLSLTVLVCRKMYGDEYCKVLIHDDSIIPFAHLPPQDHGEQDLLYLSWFNLFSLIDSPANILSHHLAKDGEHGNLPNLPLCFFLATTAIQRMVDVFYGDSHVPIEFKESDILIRKWAYANSVVEDSQSVGSRNKPVERGSVVTDSSRDTRDTRDTDATLTGDRRSSCSSSVSGREGRLSSDMSRKTQARLSDRSGKMESVSYTAQAQSRGEPSISQHATSMPPIHVPSTGKTGESVSSRVNAKQSEASGASVRPVASHFVAHALSVNLAYPPFVGDRRPKSERLLALTLSWLLDASMVRTDKEKTRGDVTDDVISGLSLHSVDLDDVPDAMNNIASDHHRSYEKRHSFGSSSSITGEASIADVSTAGDPLAIDGVSAGKAAALGALTRIVCSKATGEKLPNSQLASYMATLYQALLEKDRIVLCSLFYYGSSLFSLNLPAVEAVLPHYLFALDIILIESSKLRLHPSIHETDMRRCCLRALSTVVCWPTTFGLSRIPQLADSGSLKSNAISYIQLRARIYKTLVFSLRNETDPTNLQLTLAMCTILMEESCTFDLGLTEEQTLEMIKLTTIQNGAQPEKGLCVSFVRGLVSAVCDRICRSEWTSEHIVSLAAIDLLNALSHVHPTILFNNKDVSTGSLIVASLCRFIETQLMKPPPMHSKDLHSTVVAAYNSIAVWLCAAPMLAECESVLNTVAEAVQLGVTGSKKQENPADEKKAASKRVLEAADQLMHSLFCNVGRGPRWSLCDERRLLYLYGPSAIDTTRFVHFLVNGDTLLSFHEASHIPALSDGSACVFYVRRSPMTAPSVGVARLKPHPDGYSPDNYPPMTPLSSVPSAYGKKESILSQQSTTSRSSAASSNSTISDASTLTRTSVSGISSVSISSAGTTTDASAPRISTRDGANSSHNSAPGSPISQRFVIPPEFYKMNCKLDTIIRPLETTSETKALMDELKKVEERPERQKGNVWTPLHRDQRVVKPQQPAPTCDSIRILLYDLGLIDRDGYGHDIIPLDSGQSADFYRDLHEMVDSCPSRNIQTAHIFYVKEGQRSAVDILDNALNIQNTSGDFCGFLSGLGEGIEIGVHDSWTGHWSTAYSSERKPLEEQEAVDHYIIDGVTHALWWADEMNELCFLMPTERSLKMFKQELYTSSSASSRRSSNNRNPSYTTMEDNKSNDNSSFDGRTDSFFSNNSSRLRGNSNMGSERDGIAPYGGGGSSMGNSHPSRRSTELKVLLVWLERSEDLHNFPIDDVIVACDDGGDKPPGGKGERTSFTVIYMYQIEQGLVQIKTRGSPNRFGEAGPLCDGMVVSFSSLASFIRLTMLNINRRNVAEIENYQSSYAKRKQAIIDFSRKYTANMTYEDFLTKLIRR